MAILLKYYMDMTDWQRLQDRLDSAHRVSIGSRIGVREFWIMHRTIHELLQQADAEWVNCRRRGVGSTKFDNLLVQADDALKNFEGYILIAKLMNKEHQ